MPRWSAVACGAVVATPSAAFLAPGGAGAALRGVGARPREQTVTARDLFAVDDVAQLPEFFDGAQGFEFEPGALPSASGWGAAAAIGVALGLAGAASSTRARKTAGARATELDKRPAEIVTPIGKHGFVGTTADFAVVDRCAKTGQPRSLQLNASATSIARISADTKVAINGFGRIGRNVFRCWFEREPCPFDIVAINAGSMDARTAAHLLKYDSVLGTFKADVTHTNDALIVNGKEIKLLNGRDPASLPWAELGVEVVIESTGAFNSLDGGSKHLEGGAKKVVLTAPGKNCPTYVVGVNEGDYDAENDTVVSNASCTTNGMASVCKVLDETFGVEYGVMTTTHSYTGDQMILDGRHKDLRRARAGAMNIIPTSTGAAQAVAQVLPKFAGKLSGIALRVPVPNVSVVDLVVKVSKKCSSEDVNAALKAAADGPQKGIIKFETEPLVSSDFMGSPYSNSVDAALTIVMGEDLVKVVMWYDNEWGYSNRVIDLTTIVADTMPEA